MKKILSFCLIITLILTTLTPKTVFADESEGGTVCYIGETPYTDLKTAIDDVNSGTKTGEIKLVSDATLTSPTVLSANITITSDEDDHTVYCYNTSSKEASKYGRIFQTASKYILTVKGTGQITFVGNSEDGTEKNAGVFIAGYSKTAVINLENVAISGFTNTLNGATSKIAGAIYNCGTLNIKNCSISGNLSQNSSDTGDDIHIEANGNITLDGTNEIDDLYLCSGKTVTLAKTFSYDSKVGISLADDATTGTIVAIGEGIENVQGLYLLGDAANFSIGKDGKIKTREVAYIQGASGTKYATLAAAVAAAGAGKTIVIIDDCFISSRITRSKNLTITDDGYPHTLYFFNEDGTSDGGYGRGFQINSGTVSIIGTKTGYITISGHDKNWDSENAGPVLCAYSGTLNLQNVVIKEVTNSKNGGGLAVMSSGTANLNNTTITSCTSLRGAAVYCEGGTLNISSGTQIINNYSKGSSDPVLGAVAIVAKNDNLGLITLSGNINISGNLKNCVYQEGDDRTPVGGTSADISISDPSQLSVKGNLSGRVGIDFSDAEKPDGIFGTVTNSTYTKTAIFANGNPDLKPYVDSNYMLFWSSYTYSANFGEAEFLTEYGYSYPDFVITLDDTGANVLSIAVDRGYFFIDLENSDVTFDIFRGVKADDNYTFTSMVSGCEYRGVSITKNNGFSKSDIENLIKSVTFYCVADNQTQTVSVGTNLISNAENEFYFNGSIYETNAGKYTWSQAELDSYNENAYLVNINSRLENSMISGIASGEYWMGALMESAAWYWRQINKGYKFTEGTRTSTGFEDAYTNWNGAETFGYNRGYLMADGTWKTADSNNTLGYISEKEDLSLCYVKQTISQSVSVPVLREMDLNFSDNIEVTYYFQLSDDFEADGDNYISVEIGEGEDALIYTSTVTEMQEIESDNGYFGIIVPFAAKRLNDKVNIYAYLKSGKLLRRYGRDVDYNPCYYASVLLDMYDNQGSDVYTETITPDAACALKTMLNFGALTQELFSYNTENLANVGYEDTTETTAPESILGGYYSTSGDVTWKSASLESAESLVMRYYFQSDEIVSTATVNRDNVTVTKVSDTYYVDIPVETKELSKVFTIVINETSSLSVNAYYLIKLLLEQSTDPVQIKTADMLYKFGEAVAKYEGISVADAGALEAVLSTAYTYFVKEDNTQYDQGGLTARHFTGYKLNRRQIGISPEELSDDYYAYLDCSSFVYSVYSNVFGATAFESAIGLSASNFSTSDLVSLSSSNPVVVKNWSASDIGNNAATTYMDLMSTIQPGDLIVKYAVSGTNGATSSHGHVIMWVGTGYIHCTGKSYTFSESNGTDGIESKGAVHFVAAEDFNANWFSGCKYLTVIRPLNVLGNDNLESYGIARAEIGAMGISKTAVDITTGTRLTNGQGVSVGDEITFTIELDNSKYMVGNSNADRVVSVIQSLPEGVSFVSATGGNGTAFTSDKLVYWGKITVKQGEKLTLCYTVKVTGGETDTIGRAVVKDKDTTITCSVQGGEPGAITIKGKEIAIENNVSKSSLTALANSYINSGSTGGLTGIEFINSFYSQILGKTFSLEDSDDDLINSIFISGSSYFVAASESYILSAGLGKYIVSNVVGGRYVYDYKYNSIFTGDNRIRNVSTDNLKVGDLIAIKHVYTESLGYYYYIYLGNNKMLKVTSTSEVVSSIDADKALEGLISKGAFVAFRIIGR